MSYNEESDNSEAGSSYPVSDQSSTITQIESEIQTLSFWVLLQNIVIHFQSNNNLITFLSNAKSQISNQSDYLTLRMLIYKITNSNKSHKRDEYIIDTLRSENDYWTTDNVYLTNKLDNHAKLINFLLFVILLLVCIIYYTIYINNNIIIDKQIISWMNPEINENIFQQIKLNQITDTIICIKTHQTQKYKYNLSNLWQRFTNLGTIGIFFDQNKKCIIRTNDNDHSFNTKHGNKHGSNTFLSTNNNTTNNNVTNVIP